MQVKEALVFICAWIFCVHQQQAHFHAKKGVIVFISIRYSPVLAAACPEM